MSFFEKFFGYFQYEEGVLPYQDFLGKGAFADIRHYLLMLIVVCLATGLYLLFKKFPNLGLKIISVLSIIILVVHCFNIIFQIIVGRYDIFLMALPWSMVSLMIIVLSITIIFKIEKLKSIIYPASIALGVISIIVGDYFTNQFITFDTLERILSESFLIIIPIIALGIENINFEFKSIWKSAVLLGIGVLISVIGNVIFGKFGANYLYLRVNPFPNQIMGSFYIILLLLIYLFVVVLIYSIPKIIKAIKQ